LDRIYPRRHQGLFNDIAEKGLLLSEYPLGQVPTKYTFPQRNRIVSGLCYGVIIIEAAHRSGTLITARLAMEQNREVFVLPGSVVNPQYAGSHQLIRSGAELVTSVEQVLEGLAVPLRHLLESNKVSIHSTPSDRETDHPILACFRSEKMSIDEIICVSGLTASEVSSMLLELELIGVVAIASDGGYVNLS
jgi:DNA processing protein